MKHLLIILSILLLSSPVIGQKSSLEVKEMTSLEGVLYRSPKGGWTFKEKENSDRKYRGEIKNDLPNGQGTTSFYNGRINKGLWKNGTMHGQGIKIYPNRKKIKGVIIFIEGPFFF